VATSARVAVTGGSLGGLTAALLLRDLGHDVVVYERSAVELEQRGAGIGFLPASYRYLVERAGVDLDAISVTTERIRYLDRRGAVTHDQPHRYRFSSWNTVYRQLLACLERDRYLLGHEVAGFEQDGDEVQVTLSGGRRVGVDMLVGADGVGSKLRRTLLPAVEPAYSGYVAWRGMVAESELDAAALAAVGDAITYYVYANSHILVYPIPGADGSVLPGRRLINFVWYRNYLAGGDLDDVLTDVDGARREVSLPPGAARAVHVAELRATAASRLPPVLAEVVAAAAQPFVQVVLDVEVPAMAFGRVCLIGDAAFVARPHTAAGTAKAADDGWALAAAMADHAGVADALTAWEPGRLALGRELVARTRRVGRRSQVEGTWTPGDPELIFGLYGPGR
jgi:2,6-dihydroxypyridine 3-monooxygenase